MFCPTCGKETPAGSAFCLHCGARIAALAGAQAVVVDWEHKDFVYDFPPPGKGMWARLGSGAYSEAGAKLEFWQNCQREIYAELKKWEDDGWESVGAVDSGCIEIRTATDHRDKSAGYWLLMALFSIPTWGLLLLFALILGRSTFAEPVRCVVPMRRPRQASAARAPAKAAALHVPGPQVRQPSSFCPRCAHANRAGARFCARCGQTL
jgi:hypothetical protein